MCMVSSRYASEKKNILDEQAHPIEAEAGSLGVFHNGFIANYMELLEGGTNSNSLELDQMLIDEPIE